MKIKYLFRSKAKEIIQKYWKNLMKCEFLVQIDKKYNYRSADRRLEVPGKA